MRDSGSDPGRYEEEKLAHALISRGLVTPEEVRACEPNLYESTGAEPLLQRLVREGCLTERQAKRALEELDSLLMQQIPGFVLIRRVGQGSLGVVWQARQLSMNRIVAIKILHPQKARNADFLERFKREAHLAARLSHNNIIQAIDVGSAGPLHYFVMEYVEGSTIRESLDAGKVYTERNALDIVLQITQALEHAHSRDLVHRDVKPANIVITPDGTAKLADLGMAREGGDWKAARQERGLSVGTPYYMAPEQIEGREDIDGRADLYSLGATLYHMVTGQPPFTGKNVDVVMDAHLSKRWTPADQLNPKLSRRLVALIDKLLSKNRNRRHDSAEELLCDLEELVRGKSAAPARGQEKGRKAPDEARPPRPRRRRWSSNQLTVLAILCGLLGLSLLLNLILLSMRH